MGDDNLTKESFLYELIKNNIDTNIVNFENSIRDGFYIRKNHFRWEVFYRERGVDYNVICFPSESDALQYLLKAILK